MAASLFGSAQPHLWRKLPTLTCEVVLCFLLLQSKKRKMTRVAEKNIFSGGKERDLRLGFIGLCSVSVLGNSLFCANAACMHAEVA